MPRSRKPRATTTRRSCRERLAKLSGGVAVIKIGAATEVELKEKKARFEGLAGACIGLVEVGIIDPAKGTRCALVSAASVAGMILSTDALVADAQQHNGLANCLSLT